MSRGAKASETGAASIWLAGFFIPSPHAPHPISEAAQKSPPLRKAENSCKPRQSRHTFPPQRKKGTKTMDSVATPTAENPFAGETPALIPPQNELPGTESPNSQTSIAQKIFGAATQAYDATVRTIKKGRGRPRKDGTPKISDTLDQVENLAPIKIDSDFRPVVSPASPAPFDSKIISCVVQVVTDSSLGYFQGRQKKKMIRLGLSKQEAAELISATNLSDNEKNSGEKLTELLLEKYKVNSEWLPEIAALALVSGVTMRCRALASDLDERLAAKAKAEREAKQATS